MNRAFLRDNGGFLAFGVVVTCFSSFGQTYFIGVFRPTIMIEFSLDNRGFGLLYLLVTLGSAIGLSVFGHVIDGMPLRRYMALLILAIGSVTMSFLLSQYLITLFISLLLIRMLGQGLMVHAAMTSMSRYFEKNRGRAIAVAGLGIPIGQAIFPITAVFLIGVIGWRETWATMGAAFLIIGGPLIFFFLRGHDARHRRWLQDEDERSDAATKATAATHKGVHYNRGDVLKDRRFYMMIPALLSPAFWITAIFFFAEDIAASKGWSLPAFASLYWVNALGAISLPILGGALVDKFGGVRLLPSYPPLLALTLLTGLLVDTTLGVAFFMFLLGAVNGLSLPINNAMWAEMYGTRYLGQIKALSTSIMVLSTALAPYILGEALDAGVNIETLLLIGAVYSAISTILLLPVVATVRRR